jgi:hypothetical protein
MQEDSCIYKISVTYSGLTSHEHTKGNNVKTDL